MKKKLVLIVLMVVMVFMFVGCEERQANMVSHNLSLEADNFNVARKLSVINVRTDTVLFQITGNFSIDKETDGDLAVIGENANGTYYKHFVCLADEITYIVEDLGTTGVDKYNYQINFNPKMIMPIDVTSVD
jgi:hypothetical protein